MTVDDIFDHDPLDGYHLAIEYTAEAFSVAKNLSGVHRHAHDQWLRASQSIPLDVLTASDGLDVASSCEMKLKLKRIVSMLTRMVMKTDVVGESPSGYDADNDYEHEHRCAEHEHEHEHDWGAEPEPWVATEQASRSL